MKLKGMTFREDRSLDEVTVVMTADEAAVIAYLFGRMNAFAQDALLYSGSDRLDGVYDCISGDVFNRVYEDGLNGHPGLRAPDVRFAGEGGES